MEFNLEEMENFIEKEKEKLKGESVIEYRLECFHPFNKFVEYCNLFEVPVIVEENNYIVCVDEKTFYVYTRELITEKVDDEKVQILDVIIKREKFILDETKDF